MKPRCMVVALVLVGTLLLPSLVVAVELGELPENPLEGRKVFIGKGCMHCHAIWGEGGRLGPDLGKSGASRSVPDLAGILWNHSSEMLENMLERQIPRPAFTPQEMASLVSFLLYLNYFDEPGVPETGARLFRDKSCSRCHTVGGQGESVGPPLDRYQRHMSPLLMAQAMWNHGPQMGESMRALGVERPTFAGQEMADLLSYIRQTTKEASDTRVYMRPGNPEQGKQLFADKGCIRCHAIRGQGGQGGPDLARQPLRYRLTEVAGRMWNHQTHMWQETQEQGIPLPTFANQEMADVIAYLYFIALQGEPGDAGRGRQVFARLRCAACHAGGEAGKTPGPDLAQAVRHPIELATAMWNHAAVRQTWADKGHSAWPLVAPGEMRDLQSYLESLQGPSSR